MIEIGSYRRSLSIQTCRTLYPFLSNSNTSLYANELVFREIIRCGMMMFPPFPKNVDEIKPGKNAFDKK